VNSRYLTYVAVAITVVAIVSAVFAYTYYNAQIVDLQQKIETLENTVAAQENELSKYRNLTLVDDHGFVLKLSSYPQRIISTAPSCTEILFALGVGDKVVGVDDYSNYPYNFSEWIKAGNMTSIGGFSTPNTEVIVSLKPDLILTAGTLNDENAKTWRSMGYNVLALDPHDINGVLQDIMLVGRATGSEAQAASLVNSINARINAVFEKLAGVTEKPKVYYEIWYDPLMSVGASAWENQLIEKAGGVNIFANQSEQYFITSSEVIVSLNPDVILLPSSHGLGAPFWGSFDQVKARAGWSSISAVKNGRLYVVDSDIITRAGPRIADAIEMLAKIFHPELF